jgi:ppGpp synthetase/RelA/SpoT-type nucleotidyltranferase
LAKSVVAEILEPLNLDIHVIEARPKAFESVLEKIRRKGYGVPGRQLTDQVGVRVITYYQDDVDRAARKLKEHLEIDDRKSEDKRQILSTRQFGYRSVHLIARISARSPGNVSYRKLGKLFFEIQIRSILEHAWAEIEHEINYKSGVDFPEAILRRFGAIAGSLEILESAFLDLREEKLRLVNQYRAEYARGEAARIRFDAARLLAYLAARFPDGSPMIGDRGRIVFNPPRASRFVAGTRGRRHN